MAPYSADVVVNVVRNNKFGTKEVVFANGKSYVVNRQDTISSNNQDYLHVDDYGYRTKSCDSKVLMRRNMGKLLSKIFRKQF